MTPTEEPQQKLVISDELRVARKIDPLALDPEQMNLATLSGTDSNATEATTAAESAVEEMNPAHDDEPEKPLPANLGKVVRIKQDSGRAMASRSALIQLKRELPAVSVKDMPLTDFLTMVSQLSGVPVSIGPEQLQMAGITASKGVTVDTTEQSIGDVLAAVLDPLHLEVVTSGPQVVVVRQGATKVRSVDYPIDDLVNNAATADKFAQWLQQLIAPESWQTHGGEGTIAIDNRTLRIEQSQAVQYQVLFFLERIRLAKGLPLRSRYPKQLLAAKPFATQVAQPPFRSRNVYIHNGNTAGRSVSILAE